jgi:hypothetical protein
MGVFGTYCQLCGLPVQHDHYVGQPDGMLRIYRGSSAGGGHEWTPGDDVFAFTDGHAWLRDAVALPFDAGEILRGSVEDGVLVDAKSGTDAFVGDGMDDAAAFHAFCWELMGAPPIADDAFAGAETPGVAQVAPYQQQLFEFQRFRDDGHGELLNDPRSSAASRARIQGILDVIKTPAD